MFYGAPQLLFIVLLPVMFVLLFRKAGFRGAKQWLGALPVLGWITLFAAKLTMNVAEIKSVFLIAQLGIVLVPILTVAPLVILWRLDWPIHKQETTPMEGV